MTDEILAALDNGPDHCIFSSLLEGLEPSSTLAAKARYFLPFALNNPGAVKKTIQLQSLLEEYGKIQSTSRVTATSICKWIFYTNKLEFCSLPNLSDTQDCISGVYTEDKRSGYKETLNTFDLLQDCYAGFDQEWKKYTWDEIKIKKAHRTLMNDIKCMNKCVPGEYRLHGALALNTDDSDHLFPQHKMIPSLMSALGLVCYDLAKYIGTQVIDKILLYTFALAAFAQFHFVDIHPFADGNGRMCRFISKYILDRVLPVPFPMFRDRSAYLKTLQDARKASLDQAPVHLFHLLLDEAIYHYTAVLNQNNMLEFDHFILYTNWDEVKKQLLTCEVDNPEEHRKSIKDAKDRITLESKDKKRVRIKKKLHYQPDDYSIDDL